MVWGNGTQNPNGSEELYFILIEIHSMQGWTATPSHGVTKKKKHKKIQAYRKSV